MAASPGAVTAVHPDGGGKEERGAPALPAITEVKRTLAGVEKRFTCSVLAREGAHLIVLFVAPAAMHVHGVDLAAGTVTFGHFWTDGLDRPFNVYHWVDQHSGQTIGYYLNLSAETRITEERLEWLDLVLDILVVPPHPPVVLDEDELPADLSPALRERIMQAKASTLRDLPGLIPELEERRRTLWPIVEARTRDAAQGMKNP